MARREAKTEESPEAQVQLATLSNKEMLSQTRGSARTIPCQCPLTIACAYLPSAHVNTQRKTIIILTPPSHWWDLTSKSTDELSRQ